MADIIEDFLKEMEIEGSVYNKIKKTTDDYVDLAKKGIIPRTLLKNNEIYPFDSQKILDSFNAATSQEGRYAFFARVSTP